MDNNLALAISTGVISGVITSGLVWMAHNLFVTVFTPWLERKLYSSVLLNGTWTAKMESSGTTGDSKDSLRHERNLTLTLIQSGGKVEGNFYAKSEYLKSAGLDNFGEGGKVIHNYDNQYLVKGYVADNYLVLNYKPISRMRTGLGSFVLQITHGGTKMVGVISFLAEGAEYIDSTEVTFNRTQ